MRELVIKVAMENAAFGNDRYEEMKEATRIVYGLIEKAVERERLQDDLGFDSNGNCVASLEVIERP